MSVYDRDQLNTRDLKSNIFGDRGDGEPLRLCLCVVRNFRLTTILLNIFCGIELIAQKLDCLIETAICRTAQAEPGAE